MTDVAHKWQMKVDIDKWNVLHIGSIDEKANSSRNPAELHTLDEEKDKFDNIRWPKVHCCIPTLNIVISFGGHTEKKNEIRAANFQDYSRSERQIL